MKIGVKEVGKPVKFINTDVKYRSDCVRQFIGKQNYPEMVYLNGQNTFCFGVDEEGLLKELPCNFLIETSNFRYPIQVIAGTAVFMRTKPVDVFAEEIWDFELTDLTLDDELYISKMLDGFYQAQLKKKN